MTSVNFSIKERGSGWLYKLRPVLEGGATVPLLDSGPVSQVSFIVVSFLPDSTLEKRIGREEEETHLRHPHTRISVGFYLFSVNDNGTMLPWISGGKLWDVYKLEKGELVLQLLMVWCVKCLLLLMGSVLYKMDLFSENMAKNSIYLLFFSLFI